MRKREAMRLQPGDYIYHKVVKNADGTPLRARVTGKVKTWKTKEGFRVPCKYGMYGYFYVADVPYDHTDKKLSVYTQWMKGYGDES